MTRAEYDAIIRRALNAAEMPKGANAVIVCDRDGELINPDELGPKAGAQFKRYCEALGEAVKDRAALLKMIETDFDTANYFDESWKTATPDPEKPT